MEFCPYNGKVIHPSRAAANQALQAVRQRTRSTLGKNIYQCGACLGWHFGTPPATRSALASVRRREIEFRKQRRLH